MQKKIKMVLHLIVPPHLEIKHGISNLFLKYLSTYDFLNTNCSYILDQNIQKEGIICH